MRHFRCGASIISLTPEVCSLLHFIDSSCRSLLRCDILKHLHIYMRWPLLRKKWIDSLILPSLLGRLFLKSTNVLTFILWAAMLAAIVELQTKNKIEVKLKFKFWFDIVYLKELLKSFPKNKDGSFPRSGEGYLVKGKCWKSWVNKSPSLLVVINNCTGLLPHEVGILDPVRVLGVATGPASSHVEDPNHLLASEHLANTPEQWTCQMKQFLVMI